MKPLRAHLRAFEELLKCTFLCVLGCLVQNLAHAGEMPTDWQSIRSTGMGDADTAVANDESAPFSNPAGLSRTRNPRSKNYIHQIVFPGLVIGGNDTLVNSANRGKTKATDIFQKSLEAAKNKQETLGYLEAQSFPAIIFGAKSSATFLLGFPARSTNRYEFKDSANPEAMSLNATTTVGAVAAMAGMSRGGSASYGLSVRPNMRYTLIDDAYAGSETSLNKLKSDVKTRGTKTTGVGIDLGVLFTAGDFWLPTFGLAVRNVPTGCADQYLNAVNQKIQTVCGTRRTLIADTTAPESARVDPTEVRMGFSITPRFRVGGNRVNLRLAADAFPLPILIKGKSYGLTNVNINRLFHAGGELFFGNAFLQSGLGFRAGVNQGLPTYGATLRGLGIAIEYASYQIETGSPQKSRIDQRHLIGLTADW